MSIYLSDSYTYYCMCLGFSAKIYYGEILKKSLTTSRKSLPLNKINLIIINYLKFTDDWTPSVGLLNYILSSNSSLSISLGVARVRAFSMISKI